MSLYQQWRDIADAERTHEEAESFWQGYFGLETENYKQILSDHTRMREGTLKELAEAFSADEVTFTGFLDGINTSLVNELEIENLTGESVIKLEIDFEKLYYNMHVAKADWLYELKEWDGVLSVEARKEIAKRFRASKIFVNTETVGRNDPCPCGSGKKYKKCCGQ